MGARRRWIGGTSHAIQVKLLWKPHREPRADSLKIKIPSNGVIKKTVPMMNITSSQRAFLSPSQHVAFLMMLLHRVLCMWSILGRIHEGFFFFSKSLNKENVERAGWLSKHFMPSRSHTDSNFNTQLQTRLSRSVSKVINSHSHASNCLLLIISSFHSLCL